jgi:glutamate-ammonia-ligase adenylyltransferase
VVRQAICEALRRAAPAQTIMADTAAMHDRLAEELPPRGPWDVKTMAGGMMEVSFIAQSLQLIHGRAAPALFQPNTEAALAALAQAGHIDEDTASGLAGADFLWRTIQGINRITGLPDAADDPPPAALAALLRATDCIDISQLRAAMAETAATVREAFNDIVRGGAES